MKAEKKRIAAEAKNARLYGRTRKTTVKKT